MIDNVGERVNVSPSHFFRLPASGSHDSLLPASGLCDLFSID